MSISRDFKVAPLSWGDKKIETLDLGGLSKKFIEFGDKNKSTSVVAFKFLHV